MTDDINSIFNNSSIINRVVEKVEVEAVIVITTIHVTVDGDVFAFNIK